MKTDLEINIKNLYIEITNKCNYKCIYCYNDSQANKTSFIAREKYERLLYTFMLHGLKDVSLSGGEPFLHPDLFSFLKYNNDCSLSTRIITNASQIDMDIASKLAEYKSISYLVALDGPTKEVNDLSRGKGTFQKTMIGINNLIQCGLSRSVMIKCNLTHYNYTYIRHMIELCEKLEVNKVVFSIILPSGRASNLKVIDEEKDESLIANIYQQINGTGQTIGEYKERITSRCPYIKSIAHEIIASLRVDAEGHVFPCQLLMDQDYILGNINDNNFSYSTITESITKFIQQLTRIMNSTPECTACVYRGFCTGGCLGYRHFIKGRPDLVDGYCAVRKKQAIAMIHERRKQCDVG